MKKIILGLCLSIMVFSVQAVFAQEAVPAEEPAAVEASSDGIGITVGLTYQSNYLWRGVYWYAGDGAFFPSASYSIAGFTISYLGEYSEDVIFDNEPALDGTTKINTRHANDLGLDYSITIADMITVGGGAWFFWFYNEKTNNVLVGTVFVALDFLPLTPKLTYNHDYYIESKAKKDFYIQLGIGHDIDLIKDAAALSLGLSAGYYNNASAATSASGVSDITLSAGLSVKAGNTEITSSFNYLLVPAKDFYNVGTPPVKDMSRFYSTFGVSYSI
ncbi:MAG: hypothetical protein GY754_21250 [bacterium]|nr:hypothetical protein [bacterium]